MKNKYYTKIFLQLKNMNLNFFNIMNNTQPQTFSKINFFKKTKISKNKILQKTFFKNKIF